MPAAPDLRGRNPRASVVAVTLRPALYEGVIAMLVGLGGLAHVATNLDRVSTLWGLGIGAAGLLTLGALLVSRQVIITNGAVEFRRMVNNQASLVVPFAEIRSAGYDDKLRAFEVKTASATHRARMNRDTAKRLAKALKDAGLRAR